MPHLFVLSPTIRDEKNDFFKYMLTYTTLMNNKTLQNYLFLKITLKKVIAIAIVL